MADGPTSNLDKIDTAQSQKETTANETDDSESPASFGGRHGSACTGLTFAIYGGKYLAANGVITSVANIALGMIASMVNYIEFDYVAGTITSNTTGFTAGRIPLYSVTAGSSTVTSWVDQRFWGGPENPRTSVSVAGSANVTLTQAQCASKVIELTGAIGAAISVIVPLSLPPRIFYNGTSGAFTLTVIGASGTGVVIATGKRATLYADGTNVVRATADV